MVSYCNQLASWYIAIAKRGKHVVDARAPVVIIDSKNRQGISLNQSREGQNVIQLPYLSTANTDKHINNNNSNIERSMLTSGLNWAELITNR